MTDAPAGVGNYRIEAIVADIPRLIAALGIAGPVHVMRHDWGAVITWCLALAHPGRVCDLVVIPVGHPQAWVAG